MESMYLNVNREMAPILKKKNATVFEIKQQMAQVFRNSMFGIQT
jgi:hypothetical protein